MACYVRGCREETVIGRVHRFFGKVDACGGHDPEKHGYGRPLSNVMIMPAVEPPKSPRVIRAPRAPRVPTAAVSNPF